MVKLQKNSAQNTQPMLSKMAKDEKYIKALDLLTEHEKKALNDGLDRIYDL